MASTLDFLSHLTTEEINKKGNLMNDQVSNQMAEAQAVLDADKAKKVLEVSEAGVVYTQTDVQVGKEDKPV